MNTPAHTIVNFLLLSKEKKPQHNWPIVLGSVLPDLPMVVFYGYEKIVRGMSEQYIWDEGYFKPEWQIFIDTFNSLPLIVAAMLLATSLGAPRWYYLFASMGLHVLGDLPLHHNDAHRHFFPISHWRFESPLSYWDPNFYGHIIAPLEGLLVLGGSFILFRRHRSRSFRYLVAGVGVLYALYWAFVFIVWF